MELARARLGGEIRDVLRFRRGAHQSGLKIEGVSRSPDRNWLVVLAVVYIALFITTPYYSNRLAFLATIRFERILAAVFIIAAAFSGRLSSLASLNAILVVGFTAWLYICSFASPYKTLETAVYWRENHWELLVFFALLVVSFRSSHDVRRLIRGLFYVVLAYQLYSWLDFFRGGSYVWQQGFKRMTGTWSGGGIGSANAWGSLGVWMLPFCVEYGAITGSKVDRRAAWVAFPISLLCVIYSGTRGAMVVAGLYLIARFRRIVFRPWLAVVAAIVVVLAVAVLPTSLKHRYWDQMTANVSPQDEVTDRDEQIARDSAQGRIKGLWDGLAIATALPVFGCGPAASAAAKSEFSSIGKSEQDEVAMQLHSLWGQVVAEAGFPGLFLWCAVLAVVSASLIQRRDLPTAHSDSQIALKRSLLHALLIMMAYGFASHSLYDYRWMFLFAASCGVSLGSRVVAGRDDVGGGHPISLQPEAAVAALRAATIVSGKAAVDRMPGHSD